VSTPPSATAYADASRWFSFESLVRVLIALAAVGTIASGLFAMLAPEAFFNAVAAYPPYNRHFIHDIGAFMLGLGAGLGFALTLTDALLVGLAANVVGAVAHFLSHLIDRDLGGAPSDPATFGIFALILVAFTIWRLRAPRSGVHHGSTA
jgi:hypothetical protein